MNGAIGINTIQQWWGNTVFTKTADAQALPLRTLAPGETFGYVPFYRSLSLFYFYSLTRKFHDSVSVW